MTTGKGTRHRTSADLSSEDRRSTTPIRFCLPDVLFFQVPYFHSACLKSGSCYPCQRLNQTFQPLFKITQKKTKKRSIALKASPCSRPPLFSKEKSRFSLFGSISHLPKSNRRALWTDNCRFFPIYLGNLYIANKKSIFLAGRGQVY